MIFLFFDYRCGEKMILEGGRFLCFSCSLFITELRWKRSEILVRIVGILEYDIEMNQQVSKV